MADPSFRAVASATNDGSNGIVCNKPTGTVDGDGMIAILSLANGNGAAEVTATTLSGWTLINAKQVASFGGYYTMLYTWYKKASSEGSSYTWALSANCEAVNMAILTIQDVKSGASWIGASAQNAYNGTSDGQTSTYPSITATALSLIIRASQDWWFGGGLSPTAGYTERYDLYLYAETLGSVSAGSLGTQNQTNSNHNPDEPWFTNTIEILAEPAAAVRRNPPANNNAAVMRAANW